MTGIPPDAVDWDSGDWIEWHRRSEDSTRPPCTAASEDLMAKTLSVYNTLLHAARSFHKLTGRHLDIYRDIAVLYGRIHLTEPRADDPSGHTEMAVIAPNAATQDVTIDLTRQFDRLLLVRISPDFKVDGKVIARTQLPQSTAEPYSLRWSNLPDPDPL